MPSSNKMTHDQRVGTSCVPDPLTPALAPCLENQKRPFTISVKTWLLLLIQQLL